MIKGHCYTNLDNYYCRWPEVFASVPNKGDYVRSGDSSQKELKVVQIIHTIKYNPVTEETTPYIIIELNK